MPKVKVIFASLAYDNYGNDDGWMYRPNPTESDETWIDVTDEEVSQIRTKLYVAVSSIDRHIGYDPVLLVDFSGDQTKANISTVNIVSKVRELCVEEEFRREKQREAARKRAEKLKATEEEKRQKEVEKQRQVYLKLKEQFEPTKKENPE